ncbi:MAG: GIDE domain-containing protein [Halobacteriaceae archaeon]
MSVGPFPPVTVAAVSEDTAFLALLFGVGLFLVYDGFRTWQRKRLMQDTPTERVRSAAAGRTELTGTGRPIGEPVRRPFDDGPCLVATYEIEEYRDDSDSGGGWTTVDSGTVCAPFLLDDGTGTMRVEPDEDARFHFDDDHVREIEVGAGEEEPEPVLEFLRTHTDAGIPPIGGVTGVLFGEERRYTERWIPVGAELYLLGGAEPVGAGERNTSGLVLRRDGSSGQFIVSERSEADLVGGAAWRGPLEIGGGIALSAAALFFLLADLGLA